MHTAPAHNYQTRIRQHAYIRPTPKARKPSPPPPPPPPVQPLPPELYPPFPPPGIVLHQDDASSKVFLAIARAFVSVDNRAMTIKDIAERASRYGLVCQNLSAAAQAVTTYVRAHKSRCDRQQDHPLLLSHTLSGTQADDDLLPALHSRSGGDSHPLQNRLTNFRKGTAVWYLSRATGVPCPFTRAGIRLCDYISADPTTDERQSDHMCGEKRKRSLRGCATRQEPSDNERPPKVKLTLRLRPLIKPTPPPEQPEGSTSSRPIDVSDSYESDDESDSDSMSVDDSSDQDELTQLPQQEEEPWSLPPYPRRSIDIPSYTPSTEYYPAYPDPVPYKDPLRRSPSMPFATPPPDSEDEADDFHVAMTRIKAQEEDDELGWDADLDSEGEGETVWESPGPRSPSAPPEVKVKEEPRDVQGMLDAWEDFDTSVAVADVLSKALASVKTEPVDPWDFDTSWRSEDSTHIKQEDFGVDSLFPPAPLSPLSSLSNQFAAFGYLDKDNDEFPPAPRPRAQTVPAPTFSSSSSAREQSVPSTALVTLLQSLSDEQAAPAEADIALPPPTPCVSPLQTRCQPSFSLNRPVVVTTCHPCKPAISATQIEDISVYQMMLGAFQLLRRIDTDFVNLSPVLALAGTAPPSPPPSAVVVTRGSPEVSGTWVPLGAAQAHVAAHTGALRARLADAELDALQVFLSNDLVGLFPPALQDFHRTVPKTAVRGQFGRHFSSTLQAARWEAMDGAGSGVGVSAVSPSSSVASTSASASSSSSSPASSSSPPPLTPAGPSGAPLVPLAQQHSVSAEPAHFVMGLALGDKHVHPEEVPLSATEQQLFRELCVIPPDWEREGGVADEGEGGDKMDVDGAQEEEEVEASATAKAAPVPAPITIAVPSHSHRASSMLSDDSPLSSPLSSPTMSAAHMSPLPSPPTSAVRISFAVPPVPASSSPAAPSTPAVDTRPLRRSKRVADAALTHPAPRATARPRSRKGGASARNSLS